MKGLKVMGMMRMMMMKPHSFISFRNASAVRASFNSYGYDNIRDSDYDDDDDYEMYEPNHKTVANELNKIEPFSLIIPGIGKGENVKTHCYKLQNGVVMMKNYVSLRDQAEIVKTCQEYGMGPGGFYQPITRFGGKLNLHMMCFGRNWDPVTKYNSIYRGNDGSEAPPIPEQLVSLAAKSIQDCKASDDCMPSMDPDICIVNFYAANTGRLGLHQDRDESESSLKKGLPVVSVSIGDSAKFVYGDTRYVRRANRVLLESGDVLVFGGKSRHVFHGVTKIIPNSAPPSLIQQTDLRPGRLNLTFRQY
ncbi:DNA N(6)-methyladenine demethylase ALKBH1D-like [Rutidosis leptorrhynchoides]|uniref:DNA N(6)-methyladenine demethylase ALKBH1D-like n=1 Tax=Rutidosis leptorrhynchoides TaxID=125765 RepID=UPI003A99625F